MITFLIVQSRRKGGKWKGGLGVKQENRSQQKVELDGNFERVYLMG